MGPDHAVVVDRAGCIEDTIKTDRRARIDDCIRENDGPFAKYDALSERRPGMNDGRDFAPDLLS